MGGMEEDHRNSDDEESEDVAKLLLLLKRVRTDNIELKRNFESLKGLHLQLHDDHKQLQGRYGDLYDERVNVEKQYQALCESWRLELEDKQRQFEHVKGQIVGPRDLELIKVTMMEKMEAPFRAKCDMLAKEAESAQQNFVRQRREFEELQAAYKTLELHAQRDREVLEADYTSTVTQLRDQVAGLGQAQVKLANAERASKQLQREKADLVLQLNRLREEVEDLQQAKERASTEKDTIELRVENKFKSIQAEELQLSGLVETLTRKNRHLQKELAEAHRSNEEMFDQRLKLQTAQAALQAQQESVRKQHASEFQAQEEQHLAAARALEDKLLTLRDQLHGKERQLAELHINHQEQVTQVVESQSTRLQELEKEHARKMRETKDQNAELAARADALKDALDDSRREVEDLQHKSKRDLDTVQRSLERVQTQLAEAQRSQGAKDADIAELRAQVEQFKGDVMRLEHENEHLLKCRGELEAQVKKLSDSMQQASSSKREVDKLCDDLKGKAEIERAAHLDRAEQQRQSFAMEKSAITKRFQAAIRDQVTKHEADMKKLKRRLKTAEERVVQLGNELTDMRLRSHELEMMGSYAQDVSARDAPSLRMPFFTSGMMSELGRTDKAGGTGEAARPGNFLGADTGLSAEIEALRQRQQEYLRAAH